MPEIDDFKSRATTISAFGDFSTIDFTMLGFGEPRVVQAGVVGGSYFDVMGLRPVLGRLLNAADDGPDAAGVAVLTHRFWTTSLNSDPAVIGKTIRLGPRSATVVGVLEPSVPYPADTEIIANVVTSPHHLGATMVTGRTHRMTELFGRLAPGATLEAARAELTAVHAAMMREHPEAYSPSADVQLSVTPLRDQITAPARTILLVLLAAAGVVFVIACSNVANLILARSVRREGELAVRAALGASRGALRRTLLAESLVLCGAGAVLGVVAGPSARGRRRALRRALLRARARGHRRRQPALGRRRPGDGRGRAARVRSRGCRRRTLPTGLGLASGSVRITPGTNRRLRAFAMTQIAFSFVLLAGAGTLAGRARRPADGAHRLQHAAGAGARPPDAVTRRQGRAGDGLLSGSRRGASARCRASRASRSGASCRGATPARCFPGSSSPPRATRPANGEENPHGRLRIVAPGFFAVLGVPLLAGRDFTNDDRGGSEPVVIVSQSVAQRLFPNGDAVNRKLWWTDPLFGKPQPRRIVGVVADVDDENVVRGPALTIYHPVQQMRVAGRLFVHAAGDPYALVPAVTRIIREMSANQPVERAATLEDVRAEVLAPERLNAFVLSGFAGIALLIAVVGVAGVLAFSVSARTREFGVRLAIGSTPRHLLLRVLSEGAVIVAIGIVAGVAGGYAFGRVAASYFENVRLPGALPMVGAAAVLVGAAISRR